MQVASLDVASKRGVTCTRSVRAPCGVARCGVKMRRHLPKWRQAEVASLELYQVARQWPHLALLAHVASEPRDVAGRGVKRWRQAPTTYAASQDVASIRGLTPPGKRLQNVSSVIVGRYAHFHRRPPIYIYICIGILFPFTRTGTYIQTCIQAYIHRHLHTRAHMYVCMHVCMYVCIQGKNSLASAPSMAPSPAFRACTATLFEEAHAAPAIGGLVPRQLVPQARCRAWTDKIVDMVQFSYLCMYICIYIYIHICISTYNNTCT